MSLLSPGPRSQLLFSLWCGASSPQLPGQKATPPRACIPYAPLAHGRRLQTSFPWEGGWNLRFHLTRPLHSATGFLLSPAQQGSQLPRYSLKGTVPRDQGNARPSNRGQAGRRCTGAPGKGKMEIQMHEEWLVSPVKGDTPQSSRLHDHKSSLCRQCRSGAGCGKLAACFEEALLYGVLCPSVQGLSPDAQVGSLLLA